MAEIMVMAFPLAIEKDKKTKRENTNSREGENDLKSGQTSIRQTSLMMTADRF